jgi:hypothetical protein
MICFELRDKAASCEVAVQVRRTLVSLDLRRRILEPGRNLFARRDPVLITSALPDGRTSAVRSLIFHPLTEYQRQ